VTAPSPPPRKGEPLGPVRSQPAAVARSGASEPATDIRSTDPRALKGAPLPTRSALSGERASPRLAALVTATERSLEELENESERWIPRYVHRFDWSLNGRLRLVEDQIRRTLDAAASEPERTRAALGTWAQALRARSRAASERASAAYRAYDREHHAKQRKAVREGTYRPQDFARDVRALADFGERELFVEGLLGIMDRPPHTIERSPNASLYQGTPTLDLLKLLDALKPGATDVVVDLGAGLGKVAMLVNWFTGARTIGIELEAAHSGRAKEAAKEMGLSGVEIVQANARSADLSEGTIFYLFNPFGGEVLQEVLAKLEAVAKHHPITVCTLAMSALKVDWLTLDAARTPFDGGFQVWRSKAA
jgi:predicted RNA methylase